MVRLPLEWRICPALETLFEGSYTVTLDGVPSTFDGSPPTGPEEFQVPLFKADGLEPGEHTVAISNQPQGNKVFLDIDFVSHYSVPRDLRC